MNCKEENRITVRVQQGTTSRDEVVHYQQISQEDSDSTMRAVWKKLQDSALPTEQLYSDQLGYQPGSLWVPFDTVARSVTELHQESREGITRIRELANQGGYRKRNSELITWLAEQGPSICREDLLAFLEANPQPLEPTKPQEPNPPDNTPVKSSSEPADIDLHTFREALVESPKSSGPRTPELCDFITEEVARNLKRPASPTDVNMGSPTHDKKPKLIPDMLL